MYTEFGIMVQTDTFEEGDLICHINTWNWLKMGGLPMFFIATDTDVAEFSGKNGTYIKLIQNNPLIEK